MNPFHRLGVVLDTLWAAIDPDEPVFCECESSFTCADCLLASPVEPAISWPGATA